MRRDTCSSSGEYLDGFGDTEKEREPFRVAYEKLAALTKEISALQIDEAEKARRIDNLQYQIGELERAQLQPGEEEELVGRRDLLRNAGKLIESVEGAHLALSGDEERDGAAALAAEAEDSLRSAARISTQAAELLDKLTELRCAADDLAEQVRDLRDSFDFEPGELDEIESRLDVLHRLKKKYGQGSGTGPDSGRRAESSPKGAGEGPGGTDPERTGSVRHAKGAFSGAISSESWALRYG